MFISKELNMTQKHTAKKLAVGKYLYRGYQIVRASDYYDSDYVHWNIGNWEVCPLTGTEGWSYNDSANTLSDAKWLIDSCEDRKVV
jgi:hypothetical protein